ncbi:hypothetical protein ACTQ6A_02195 [Lachnospiraceae bacterium LCP25S3_G4]
MTRKLVIDGNAVYELDEECMLKKKKELSEKRKEEQKNAGNHLHNNIRKGPR